MLDQALAYIDPGSGSLLIQVLIASVLAVPYFLRTQIGRAVSAIRRRGRSDPAVATMSEDPPHSEVS
ncbi:MAG: hypothetical protein FIA92_14975 [Chloroflexi bacterium]|nr:hypothetical protein [Chloroflexota bacterium]